MLNALILLTTTFLCTKKILIHLQIYAWYELCVTESFRKDGESVKLPCCLIFESQQNRHLFMVVFISRRIMLEFMPTGIKRKVMHDFFSV